MRILAVTTSSTMRMSMSESIFQLLNAYKRRRSEVPRASFSLTHSLIKGLSYHNQSSFWIGSKVTRFRDGTRSSGQDNLHRLKLTKEEEEDIVITKVSKPEINEECSLSLFGRLLIDQSQNQMAFKDLHGKWESDRSKDCGSWK